MPLLTFTGLPVPSRRKQQAGLLTERGRNLDHVEYLARGPQVLGAMDVGEHRQLELALDPGEGLEALVEAGALEGGLARRSSVSYEDLKMSPEPSFSDSLLQALGGRRHHALVLDHARARDPGQGPAPADVHAALRVVADLHFPHGRITLRGAVPARPPS